MDPVSIGLAAGSLGLGVAGLLRKPTNYGYSKGDLDYLAAQRSGEIDSFSKQLAELRARYNTQITNFGNNTFNRFSPNAEASYAAKGFAPNGGAFQSALARKAAEIQDSEMMNMLNLEHGDIGAVDSAKSNLFSARAGFRPSAPSADPTAEAFGQLSSGLGSLAMNRATTPSPSSGGLSGNLGTAGMGPQYQPQWARRSIFSSKVY
jgi:hypothetical protein